MRHFRTLARLLALACLLGSFAFCSMYPSGAIAQDVPVNQELPSDEEILKFLAGEAWPDSLYGQAELQAEFLKAGPLVEPKRYPKSIQHLAAIVGADPEAATNEQRRRTAVAVALEFSTEYNDRSSEEAVERYQWYRDAQAAGKLHPSYENLQAWERRFVVNIPWQHGNGSPEELDWLNTYVKLPAHQYPRACWQAPYRSHNLFGESVHGKNYYLPFREEQLGAYEMRVKVGGVCGGLSHFGAAAARANGIGATTMGEPGHCAYAVRLDGKWIPSYSLSPDRSAHQAIAHKKWPEVELQEIAFADPQKTLEAARYWFAGLMKAKEDPTSKEAAKLVVHACQIQPANALLWESRFRLLQAASLDNEAAWWEQARELGRALKGYPLVVVRVVRVLDQKKGLMADASQRGRMMAAAMQEAIGPDAPPSPAQDWGKVLDQMYEFSGKNAEDHKLVFRAIAKNIMQGPDAQHFVQDALVRFKTDPEVFAFLCESAKSGLANDSGGDTEGADDAAKKARTKLVEKLLVAAAARRDCQAFQQFAALHPALEYAGLAPVENPFGGDLVSEGGSIRFSTTSRYDHLAGHAPLLDMKGGSFHTAKNEDEWAEITLPKTASILGLIIDNSASNQKRNVPIAVEVSEDGENWTEVWRSDKTAKQWRVDLKDSTPRARYVRIKGSVGRADYMHLRRILVYGTPQA